VTRDKKQLLSKDIHLPPEVKGEIKEGQHLGEMVIRFNKEEVGKVDLVSPVSVPKAGFFYRLFN
jgi:D-alanyl-D-alanine carboxypeptidase (penicillin-binding protein 5/6)